VRGLGTHLPHPLSATWSITNPGRGNGSVPAPLQFARRIELPALAGSNAVFDDLHSARQILPLASLKNAMQQDQARGLADPHGDTEGLALLDGEVNVFYEDFECGTKFEGARKHGLWK
jgi:hypothetical protein